MPAGIELISKVISTDERRVLSEAKEVPEHPGANVYLLVIMPSSLKYPASDAVFRSPV